MATSTPGTGTGTDEDPLHVTLDLIAEDALLREAIGEPSTIRLPGGAVITIPHASDWTHLAARCANIGAWDAWATDTLSGEDQAAFREANLRGYQIQRILAVTTAAAGTTPGKPQPSSSSRGTTKGS